MISISSKLMLFWLVAICSLFSALFLPSPGYSEVDFNKTTPVPNSLQKLIESKIEEKCSNYTKSDFRLVEHKTFVRPVRIDGLVSDHFYTTVFRTYRTTKRYPAEFLGDVVLNSGMIAVENENQEVTRIDGPSAIKCGKSASTKQSKVDL